MSSSVEDENICQCAGSTSLSQYEVIVLSSNFESNNVKILKMDVIL